MPIRTIWTEQGKTVIDDRLISGADGGFRDGAIREQLTDPAVAAVLGIARSWKLTNAEGAGLLGVSVAVWKRMKSGQWKGTLGQDQMTRAAILIALHADLHALAADDSRANNWPRQASPMFNGTSPAQAMVRGGLPLMHATWKYIEANVANSDQIPGQT